MGEVFFYHLTSSGLEQTLTTLLGKSLEQGWRVAVRGRTDATLDRLDEQLWLRPEDSFLPHGRAGGTQDAMQPVLLTTGAAENDPTCLVSVEGADLSSDEVEQMTRSMILFDGNDPSATQTAREQWKSLTASGAKAKYWSEETGRWQMKAES